MSAITILADNTAAPGLRPAHGFSALVETAGRRILFDTGHSAATLETNARSLRCPLDHLDAVVLSHGHYDHTSGLDFVLRLNPGAHLFLHPAAIQAKYSRRATGPVRFIGMPETCRAAVASHPGPTTWTHQPAEVAPGVWCTGEIPLAAESFPREAVFFLDRECQTPDPLIDDQALCFPTRHGIAVLLGCTHAGLANTLHAVCRITAEAPLAAIAGGLHLLHASDSAWDAAAALLESSAATLIAPGHCTGADATARIARRLGARFRLCAVGARYTWEAA